MSYCQGSDEKTVLEGGKVKATDRGKLISSVIAKEMEVGKSGKHASIFTKIRARASPSIITACQIRSSSHLQRLEGHMGQDVNFTSKCTDSPVRGMGTKKHTEMPK